MKLLKHVINEGEEESGAGGGWTAGRHFRRQWVLLRLQFGGRWRSNRF